MSDLLHAQQGLCKTSRPVIFDVGMQHGDTTKQYLDNFLGATVYGFEPEPANFRRCVDLLGKTARLINAAVSDLTGSVDLHVNSHSGTHSVFEIGEVGYWLEPGVTLRKISVPSISLDDFCREHSVARIDILKMDIQGGELKALEGARSLLSAHAIGLLALEVEFKPLYKDQPLCADIERFLAGFGYGLHGLYECQHVRGELSWADAIFR